MSYNKILSIIFFVFAISLHITAKSHTTSKVTNNTSKSFYVYWTAAGCGGISHHFTTEVCKVVKIGAHSSAIYKFASSKTNIQVKIQADCSRDIDDTHVNYCPSGSGKWKNKRDGICMLEGKGRGHVKNVVINDFSVKAKSYHGQQCLLH